MAFSRILRTDISAHFVLAVAAFTCLLSAASPAVSPALAEPETPPAADDPFSVLGFEKKPGEENLIDPVAAPSPAGLEQPAGGPAAPAKNPDQIQLKGDTAVEADPAGAEQPDAEPKPSPTANSPAPDKTPEGDLSIFGIDEAQIGIESQTPQQQRHRRLIEAILERLESTSEQSRFEAAVALKETVLPADVPLLVQSLKSGGGIDKQVFIAEILGEMHDVSATGALRNEVEHGEKPSQIASTRALGRLGNDYPVPLLSGLITQGGNEELSLSAIAALGRIGSTAAVYALNNTGGLAAMDARGRALKWALARAKIKNVDDTTTQDIPQGRKIERVLRGTKYMYYQPDYRRKPNEKTWLLVCVHSGNLDVDAMFETCVDTGRKLQVAVLAPYFDYSNFPEYGDLNIRGDRADRRLLEIIEHLGTKTDINTRQFYLYGNGEGAEFVQRFAYAYPERVARAVVLYTDQSRLIELNMQVFFPQGLKTNPFAPDLKFNFDTLLPVDMIFLKGALDTTRGTPIDRYLEKIKSLSNQYGVKNRVRQVLANDWAQISNLMFSDSN